jgi:peptidoglycan/xylan/chitin deacetylase (PgdA/CDA1 family)
MAEKMICRDGSTPVFDVPILVYHRIDSNAVVKDPWRYTVSIQRFQHHMRYLYDQGYHSLSLKEVLQSSRNERAHRIKGVAITFDDGYESFYTLAFPILKRFGFKATVFVVTDRIGEGNNHKTEGQTPFLNWKQVISLYIDGIEFGSHTCSHPRLSQLSSAEVRRELFSSKECLEDKLGTQIQVLAYPYGDSNLEVQQIASEAGYEAAYGIRGGKRGRLNIWRNQCRTNDTLLDFQIKLTKWPHYANLAREETSIGQFVRKVKHSIIR